MKKIWSDRARDDYLYWQKQDKKTLKYENKGRGPTILGSKYIH